MVLSFTEKISGFLVRPAETFRAVRGESPNDAVVFYLLLLVFTSVLSALMVYLGFAVVNGSGLGIDTGSGAGVISFVWALVFTYIWGLLTLVVWAIVLQMGGKALGTKSSFGDAFKIAVYAEVPFLLLAWIPIVGWLIGNVWAVVLAVIGVRELFGVSSGKAAIVAVVALILLLMVAWILALFGITMAIGLAGIMGLLG